MSKVRIYSVALLVMLAVESPNVRADFMTTGNFNQTPATQVYLYQINITDYTAFSATTANAGTDPGLDTMLFLFKSDFKGLEANDDTGGNPQSTLSAASAFGPTSNGTYYLGVTISANVPDDGANPIFPLALGSTTEVPADPSAGPAVKFQQLFDPPPPSQVYQGNFRLDVTGADLVGPAQLVPEPSSLALVGLGVAGVLGCVPRRKVA
jgi:hypothetical protein